MAKNKLVRGTCTVIGCDKPHKSAGYCASHYQRHKRGVDAHVVLKTRDRNPPEKCVEPECLNSVKAKGLCQVHYARLLRHGFTRFKDRKRPPKFCTVPECENHLYAKGLCNRHYLRQRLGAQKYGVTLGEIAAMQQDQGGLCAICREVQDSRNAVSGKVTDFSVDHCHSTGKVRALLCSRCNRGIGMFEDNPTLLRAAADYLDLHAKRSVPS